MKGTSARATIAALLLLGVTIPAGTLRAQAQQDLYSPVIYAHQQNITMRQTIEDLELIAKVCEPEELENRVWYLPLR